MGDCFGYHELKALQELINPSKNSSDSDDDLSQAAVQKFGPGDIGAQNGMSQNRSDPHAPLKTKTDDIWHSSEAAAFQSSEVYDPREVPEYEMKFKQTVTAEDVFLGEISHRIKVLPKSIEATNCLIPIFFSTNNYIKNIPGSKMGFKTPGTASCEWLSVLVKMPREVHEKIELSVETEAIDVRSPRYRLHLETPHPIDPNASSAKWHGETSSLEITLKLVRELDHVNF